LESPDESPVEDRGAVSADAVLAVEKSGATAAGGANEFAGSIAVDAVGCDAVGGVIAATAGESVGSVYPLEPVGGGVV
jgi:hypothetical protein